MINIAGFLRSKVVRDTIPVFFSDKDTPAVRILLKLWNWMHYMYF